MNRIKAGKKVIVRAHCLIGIIIVYWNHYSLCLRTSTLRATGLEPWWSHNKPLFPLPPLFFFFCLPLFPLLFSTSFFSSRLFPPLQSIMALHVALVAVRGVKSDHSGEWTMPLYSLLKYPSTYANYNTHWQ